MSQFAPGETDSTDTPSDTIGPTDTADAADTTEDVSIGDGEQESTLRITLAVPEQAKAVLTVLRGAFAEQATLVPPSGAAGEQLETIVAAIESGQTVVALLDGDVVGTVRHHVLPDTIYLGRLGVLPEYRRLGVASALVEWCQEVLAPAESRTTIDVEIRAALPGNIALFRGLGFSEIGSYPHPLDSRSLVRKLRWRAARGRRGGR